MILKGTTNEGHESGLGNREFHYRVLGDEVRKGKGSYHEGVLPVTFSLGFQHQCYIGIDLVIASQIGKVW